MGLGNDSTRFPPLCFTPAGKSRLFARKTCCVTTLRHFCHHNIYMNLMSTDVVEFNVHYLSQQRFHLRLLHWREMISKSPSPFAEAFFEGPSQWPASPGRWRRARAEPEPGWRHRGPAGAWQSRSSGWGCRPCNRGLPTAGGWPPEASGAPARIGPCRRGPSGLLGCSLYDTAGKRRISVRKTKIYRSQMQKICATLWQ